LTTVPSFPYLISLKGTETIVYSLPSGFIGTALYADLTI